MSHASQDDLIAGQKLFCLFKHTNVHSVFLFFNDTGAQLVKISGEKKAYIALISIPLTANPVLMQI